MPGAFHDEFHQSDASEPNLKIGKAPVKRSEELPEAAEGRPSQGRRSRREWDAKLDVSVETRQIQALSRAKEGKDRSGTPGQTLELLEFLLFPVLPFFSSCAVSLFSPTSDPPLLFGSIGRKVGNGIGLLCP